MAIAGLDAFELVELALLLVAVGMLSGFLAGVFGIGGGAILVPVFYECFRLAGVPLEVRMPLCIGTSLAIIIPTSIQSWRARLCLCRLARGRAFSRCRRAAIAVRDRLRLADRCRAGDADQPVDRAARGEGRARDVEAHAGNGVRLLSVYRGWPVCAQSAVM